jgi:hypothetical protein
MRADRALSGFWYQVDIAGPFARNAGLERHHQYQYRYAPKTALHVFAHVESQTLIGLATHEAKQVQLSIVKRQNI